MSRNISTGWDEELSMLVEMGFTAAQAHRALELCGGKADEAYDLLCSSAKQVPSSQVERPTSTKNYSLNALVGMGFDSAKARQALDATDGRLDDAVQYLLSGKGEPEDQSAAPKKKVLEERRATEPGAVYCDANTSGPPGRKKSLGRAELFDDDGSRAPSYPARGAPAHEMMKKPNNDEVNRASSVEATGRHDALGTGTAPTDGERATQQVRSSINIQSRNRVSTPRPPQSNTRPGAFPVGGSSVTETGTVVIGTPHQEERTIQTRSLAPVEAEIVEDDLQERRELEAQLRRVLDERENAVVAEVVDHRQHQAVVDEHEATGPEDISSFSYYWTKRRKLFILSGIILLVALAVAIGMAITFSGREGEISPSVGADGSPSSAPTAQAPDDGPPTIQSPTSDQAPVSYCLGRKLRFTSGGGRQLQFAEPQPRWTATFAPMLDNTGLVWAPDDSAVYATSSDGQVGVFHPDDGNVIETFQPSGDGTVPFSCNGEVDFGCGGDTIIYAVSEGDSCKVYALGHGRLDMKWTSEALAGACEGTPRHADDDAYVFITHNAVDGSMGRFSVLDTAAGGAVVYTFEDPLGPFGPFGFYESPFPGGNYGAGAENTNDFAVWGNKPSPGATGGESGAIWAFQMPPASSIGGPAVTKIIETTGYRHTAPPRLASMGQWAYWLISRSAVRAWYGSSFTIGADGEYSFGRGVPPFKAAPYTPAINGDVPTIMCGGPADESFACFDATNINEAEGGDPLWTVVTGGTGVFGDPVMSPDYSRVYWTDNAGLVSSANPATGMDGWVAPTGANLEANPVMSSDGGRLFFADVSGTIVCWDVAESTLGPAPPVPA